MWLCFIFISLLGCRLFPSLRFQLHQRHFSLNVSEENRLAFFKKTKCNASRNAWIGKKLDLHNQPRTCHFHLYFDVFMKLGFLVPDRLPYKLFILRHLKEKLWTWLEDHGLSWLEGVFSCSLWSHLVFFYLLPGSQGRKSPSCSKSPLHASASV